jgi:hypothetical protein
VTRDRWMQIERLQWEKARREHPNADMAALSRSVRQAMVKTHGPPPPKPSKPSEPKPPWWARIALRILSGKLEKALEGKMDGRASSIPKWALALIAGVAAIGGTVQAALTDNAISAQEWVAIANAFVVAAWAKFSNPEKKLSPKPTVK